MNPEPRTWNAERRTTNSEPTPRRRTGSRPNSSLPPFIGFRVLCTVLAATANLEPRTTNLERRTTNHELRTDTPSPIGSRPNSSSRFDTTRFVLGSSFSVRRSRFQVQGFRVLCTMLAATANLEPRTTNLERRTTNHELRTDTPSPTRLSPELLLLGFRVLCTMLAATANLEPRTTNLERRTTNHELRTDTPSPTRLSRETNVFIADWVQ